MTLDLAPSKYLLTACCVHCPGSKAQSCLRRRTPTIIEVAGSGHMSGRQQAPSTGEAGQWLEGPEPSRVISLLNGLQ